jgi:hypothetical protein
MRWIEKENVSITGLDSSWAHMLSTACSAAARSLALRRTWISLPARTSSTVEKPSVCSAFRIDNPCGSFTDGFNSTWISASQVLTP